MTQYGPHFLGIGAQRAGTTWVNAALAKHPDVWMPPIKALHYVDLFADRELGVTRLRAHLPRHLRNWARLAMADAGAPACWRDLVAMARYDLGCLPGDGRPESYRRLLRRAADAGKLTGEITPAYPALPPEAVARVRALLGPDVKAFLVLRDPIDRMWSHASMAFSGRRGGLAGVSEAELTAFVESEDCRSRTRNADAVRNWRAALGADNLFIGHFEDIAAAPDDFLERLERFLGLVLSRAGARVRPTNSYASRATGPPPSVLQRFGRIGAEECARLMEMAPSEHVRVWHARAEALSAGAAEAAW